MRIVSVAGRAALLYGAAVHDIAELSGGTLPSDPVALLSASSDELRRLRPGGGRPLADVTLDPPVVPPLVLAVVANDVTHPPTPFPMIVGKSPTSVCGPFSDIVLPDPRLLPLGRRSVIPEPELGVVTRAVPRHVTEDQAAQHIAGYVVAQDVTERVHEFGPGSSPWTWSNLPAKTLGKSFDTFCPIGPALVTPDEVNPAESRKRCWINGRLAYELGFDDMQWKPAQLVSLISHFLTVPPGTLILCGSGPPLDGPPPSLGVGDAVRTEISGIGAIENRCVAESVPEVPLWDGEIRRTITVATEPAWRYFAERSIFESWFGPCRTFDLRPGGRLEVTVAGRFEAVGEFLAVEPGQRLSLQFGYLMPDIALGPGSTTVSVQFTGPDVTVTVTGIHPALVQQQEATWDFLLARLTAVR
ncbi:MAG TPA: fumarylacetoacetate hydrolase family protein [Mycobacteriales bacterium]|nr:fumarylacetoacetate hydrolase family protein [Mycobacteriales bacterium]